MGAICEFCKGDMRAVNGCNEVLITTKDGKKLNPIKYGDETPDYYDGKNPETCHDCGARLGYFHHPGCDWEECPNCHGQLLSCDCQVDDEEDPRFDLI